MECGSFYGVYWISSSEVDAAKIIRRFVHNELTYPYEWDDFETITEDNPDVAIALNLCWYFANKYPERTPAEYCSEDAFPYFLAVAEALERNLFSELDHRQVIESLRNNELPDNVRVILERIEKEGKYKHRN
jgi:hypothetical protein